MNVSERLEPVIRRCKAFYAAHEPGHFLVRVAVKSNPPAIPPLAGFDLDRQLEQYLDHKLAAARVAWQAKDGIDDDAIASICPGFGIAEHSAWTGTEVRLQESTCLPVPLLETWKDWDKLRLSTETPWYGYMKKGYEYLRSRKDGSFVLSVRGIEMPMDLANAVRGDDLFMDFLDEPQQVHRLMDWCTQALPWYYDQLVSWADQFQDGNVFHYNSSWLGPRCYGHTSNDAAMLCSTQVYEEFGYPYELRLIENYGGVFYHLHTEKMHYLPKLATLPKLRLLEMTDDPKTPLPIEDLPNIFAHTGGGNLVLYGNLAQVRRQIEPLKSRNVFLHVRCETKAEAREAVRFVRRHSKPLE